MTVTQKRLDNARKFVEGVLNKEIMTSFSPAHRKHLEVWVRHLEETAGRTCWITGSMMMVMQIALKEKNVEPLETFLSGLKQPRSVQEWKQMFEGLLKGAPQYSELSEDNPIKTSSGGQKEKE